MNKGVRLMSVIEQYYNDKAGTYDSEQRFLYFKVYDFITWKYTQPYIPKETEAKVLDAAGGTWKWSIPIAREGPKVVLVDLSDGMLDVARKKISEAGLDSRIEARQGDITRLDFGDEAFDMVFCDHALCFVKDIPRTLRELVRVLKKNSPIVISAQNRYPLSLSLFAQDLQKGTKILDGEEYFLMQGRLPVQTLFPDNFRALLENNSLRVSKMIGKGILLTPLIFPMEKFWTENYDRELLDNVMKAELDLCERRDALALAGHMQAIGYRSRETSSLKAQRTNFAAPLVRT